MWFPDGKYISCQSISCFLEMEAYNGPNMSLLVTPGIFVNKYLHAQFSNTSYCEELQY